MGPDAEGVTKPAWLLRQVQALLAQRGHAWLLSGPSGLGQYDLALELAQAWLCEAPTPNGACGSCSSCHSVAVRAHPDLYVLMPEAELLAQHWPVSEKALAEIDEKKRKPSKEIRIDALRAAIEFSQRTCAKGRGKVVLVYPAEMMNTVTANALLKTLEEPPGDTRFVLSTHSLHQLLPTIRSRCLSHLLIFPELHESLEWLQQQGVSAAEAKVLLAAGGGRPMDALALSRTVNSSQWLSFPMAMAQGDVGAVSNWSVQQLLTALQKLCHDQLAVHAGAEPRFFPPKALFSGALLLPLSDWAIELRAHLRTVEHPYNPGLLHETLVNQARLALHCKKT